MDLQKFCSVDNTRYQISKPWSRDGRTYATDGRILIKMSQRDDVPENPDAPDANKLFADADKRDPHTWHPIPAYTLIQVPCTKCDGEGRFKNCGYCNGKGYVGRDEHDCRRCSAKGKRTTKIKSGDGVTECEDCRGTGQGQPMGHGVIKQNEIQIGIQGIFLELIKDLPGIKIGTSHRADGMTPVRLKFEEGEGLLMPYRLGG